MSDEMKSVDILTVERLLHMRRPPAYEDDCDEAVALASHGLAGPEEIARAGRHLEKCALCRESLLTLASFDSLKNADAKRAVAEDRADTRNISLFSKKRLFFAAAAVMLVVLTAVFTIYRPWSKDRRPGEGLVIKGPTDRFQIAVQREDRRFTARPLDRLLEGDRLGLFYSAEKPGFLAVVNIDEDGHTTVLYPSNSPSSAPIVEGDAVPIPDGAIVRGGRGCEWVLAIFSDKPLDTAFLKESSGRAKRNSRTCELSLDISGTRQIRTLSFKR